MKSPVGVGVQEKTVFVLIINSAVLVVLVCTLRKIIPVNKVVACVVRRIYVPTDFDTKEKALSVAKAAEKGLK